MEWDLQQWPTNRLIEYARNPRKNDHAVDKIAAAIREYGFRVPIIAKSDGSVVDGHLRLKAAKKLKLEKLPVLLADDLTDAQIKAFRLSVNRMADEAMWDEELLQLELEELQLMDVDISLIGFDEDELTIFLNPEPSSGLTDPDEIPDAPDVPLTVEGDIWICGDHRLMCGDSTNLEAVKSLLGSERADLLFTDPPYNVAFNGRSNKHEVIKNDKLTDQQFHNFISQVCETIKAIKPRAYYVWCNWKFYEVLKTQLDFKTCIVWAKNVFGMGHGYRHQHEFCLFNGNIDGHITNESDLWQVKKDTQYVHPTQKPVELSVRAFGNHIKLINVLDLFGGSGSTLIGAEQTRRKAFLMELDPKYCDVIITRWQNFTGKQAIHEATNETYDDLMEARSQQTSV